MARHLREDTLGRGNTRKCGRRAYRADGPWPARCTGESLTRRHLPTARFEYKRRMAVTTRFHDFVCPECRVPVKRAGDDAYTCDTCSRIFPFYTGIPDFRLEGMSDTEWRETEILVEHFDRCTFEELFELSTRHDEPQDLIEADRQYELQAVARGGERLLAISKMTGGPVGGRLCLDIGCSTGGALVPFATSFHRGVGIDNSMTDLILGKKLLQEYEVENVTLVCGSPEALPFAANTFDLINATDVLEHVSDQPGFLKEANRVLTQHSVFCFRTANRFNLFGVEPDVNLWGVGFLPRSLMGKYVRMRKGIDWYEERVRLLSRRELIKMLEEIPGTHFEIRGPMPDASNADWSWKRKIARAAPATLSLANKTLRSLVPSFQVALHKDKASPVTTPRRKTRKRGSAALRSEAALRLANQQK